MFLRRAAYIVQFPLAIALPVWVLVGRAFIHPETGWDVAVYLVASPILFLALVITSGLVVARRSAREAKAVSWPDAGLQLPLWVALVEHGVADVPWLALLVILLVVALFWVALIELVTDTRRRVTEFVDGLALTPRAPGEQRQRQQAPRDIGEVFVVKPPVDAQQSGPDSR